MCQTATTIASDALSFVVCQDLVEKVMMLRKSIERLRNNEVAVQSPILAEKLTCYAGILAAEGSLATAMTYLPEDSDQVRRSMILEILKSIVFSYLRLK